MSVSVDVLEPIPEGTEGHLYLNHWDDLSEKQETNNSSHFVLIRGVMRGILAARERILHILSISRTQGHSFWLSLLHEAHSLEASVFRNARSSLRLDLPPLTSFCSPLLCKGPFCVSSRVPGASAREAEGLSPYSPGFGSPPLNWPHRTIVSGWGCVPEKSKRAFKNNWVVFEVSGGDCIFNDIVGINIRALVWVQWQARSKLRLNNKYWNRI